MINRVISIVVFIYPNKRNIDTFFYVSICNSIYPLFPNLLSLIPIHTPLICYFWCNTVVAFTCCCCDSVNVFP